MGLGHDAQIGGLFAAPGEGRHHRLNIGVVHQQGGNHADPVGGGPPRGVKPGCGHLQSVAVKIVRVGGLIQHVLAYALAEGAAADHNPPPGIPDAGGHGLGGAGALAVHQHDQRLFADRSPRALKGAHPAVLHLVVEVAAGAAHPLQHVHGGVGVAAGVVAQVQHPGVHLAVVFLQRPEEGLAGVGAKAVAVDIAHAALQQLDLRVGYVQRPAGEGIFLGLPVSEHGHLHRGALLPHQQLPVALLGGDAGHAVHRHNQVTGLEARFLGAAAGHHAVHLQPLLGKADHRADAHQIHLALHIGQERLVLLPAHVVGIGVAQLLKQLVQAVRLIGALGYVEIVSLLQQLQRLGHREGGGGGGQQRQRQHGAGKTGKTFFHSGSPLCVPAIL